MSVSGSRPADANTDAYKHMRAQSGQQSMDERLAELIRLVDSTGGLAPAPERPFDAASDHPGEMTPAEAAAPGAFDSGDRPSQEGGKAPTQRPSGLSMAKVSALVVAGLALLGAGFGVWAGRAGAPKATAVVVAEGPARAPQPNPESAAAAIDAGAALPKGTQPASVKVAVSEPRPADAEAHAPVTDTPEPPAIAPAPAAPAQPANGASAGPPAAAPIGAPAVANSASSQTPESGPAPQALLSTGAAPGATTASSVADPDKPAQAAVAPRQPAKQAAKAESARAAAASRSRPRPESTAQPPGRPPARVFVAKADASAPGAGAQPPAEPARSGATIIAPPAVETQEAPPAVEPREAPPAPLAPLAHAIDTVVGALAPRPVQQAAASNSRDWAVQFAAPKTEAQAVNSASRLTAKYAGALNGAKISVQKTQANGETVYALRAYGLTKAEAAALCERVKGRNCSLAK